VYRELKKAVDGEMVWWRSCHEKQEDFGWILGGTERKEGEL